MGSIQKSYITILDLDPINTGAKFMKKHFVQVGHVKVLLKKTNAISCLSPYMKRKTVEEFDQNQRKLFDDFSDPLPTLRFCDEIWWSQLWKNWPILVVKLGCKPKAIRLWSKIVRLCHLCGQSPNKSNNTELNYRTRAIITRGLYILNPLFEVQKCFFKEVF